MLSILQLKKERERERSDDPTFGNLSTKWLDTIFTEIKGLISKYFGVKKSITKQHRLYSHFCEMFRIGTSIRTESRLAVARGLGEGAVKGEGKNQKGLLMGTSFLSEVMKMF